ncbi:MAG: hypothetical protein H7315_04860 [Herminiimonas sp.]|nr:hypothetical protein [Herminiimonas sp.]
MPILLIAIGGAWLLHSLNWMPDVQWLWIIGLAGSGLAILILDGITKSSLLAGPLLILAGFLSFFRQYHGLGWRFIVPAMLVSAGMLMLVARTDAVPESRRFNRRAGRKQEEGKPHD